MAGIFNSLAKLSKSTGLFWKLCFVAGMISGPQYFYWKYGRDFTYNKTTYTLFDTDNYAIKHLSLFGWVLGGVLVGFGTAMSGGCTSGHFVCGIPQRKARSTIATIVFLCTAIGMATYRHNHPFMEKGNIITKTI